MSMTNNLAYARPRPVSARLDRKGRPSLAIPLAISFVGVAGAIAIYFAVFGTDAHVEDTAGQSAVMQVEGADGTAGTNAGAPAAAGTDVSPAGEAETLQSAPATGTDGTDTQSMTAPDATSGAEANTAADPATDPAGSDTQGAVTPTPSGPEGRDNNAATTE